MFQNLLELSQIDFKSSQTGSGYGLDMFEIVQVHVGIMVKPFW